MARVVRYGDVLSVLMIDLDGFKQINDQRGHAEGDALLCEVPRVLRAELRDGDVLARYGGDEFCILLPNTTTESALAVAERLRQAIEEKGFGADESAHVRLSVGVASSGDVAGREGKPTDSLLTLADHALFRAKRSGGNKVIRWTPE